MSKTRQQAKNRKIAAYIFFGLGLINILMKLLGISVLDTSAATTFSGAIGIKLGYYLAPALFIVIGWFLLGSSQEKSLQASYEDGSYRKK